jgi:hypothetical protein
VTAAWYDLGLRLHAASTGRPASRLAHAPVPLISNPVAVRARQRGESVQVTAAAPGTAARTAAGHDALALLHDLGVRITAGAWRTLVTDDAATLPALAGLAATASRDGDQADTAAHIAWWADRADFPGSSAVVPLVAGCRARWVTGAPPDAETRAATWRAWLGVPDESCAGMLAVLALLHAGEPLKLLDRIERDDAASWGRARQAHADHWDWRQPDSPARAAIGLQARCDTAELYAAALLSDPLYRRRAVHTGHVVTGTIRLIPARRAALDLTCDRLDSRLRAGTEITGWAGGPQDASPQVFSGQVSGAAVTAGALVLTITDAGRNMPASGARVTVHAAGPTDHAFTSGRHRLIDLYGRRTSWLTTGRRPAVARRDVPLEVIVAAADNDPPAR